MADTTHYKILEGNQIRLQETLEGLQKNRKEMELRIEANAQKLEDAVTAMEAKILSFMQRVINTDRDGDSEKEKGLGSSGPEKDIEVKESIAEIKCCTGDEAPSITAVEVTRHLESDEKVIVSEANPSFFSNRHVGSITNSYSDVSSSDNPKEEVIITPTGEEVTSDSWVISTRNHWLEGLELHSSNEKSLQSENSASRTMELSDLVPAESEINEGTINSNKVENADSDLISKSDYVITESRTINSIDKVSISENFYDLEAPADKDPKIKRSEGGLFVDMFAFLSFGKDYVVWNNEKTKHPVYSHIKQTVKLGTITSDLDKADVYSYPEDDSVEDPLLAQHLAHFGINFSSLQKTEMTTAEMELDSNTKFDWNHIQESGEDIELLFGLGYAGLANIGNSCYMAATMQLTKLAHGLLSGKYSIGAAEAQEGIRPRIKKKLELNQKLYLNKREIIREGQEVAGSAEGYSGHVDGKLKEARMNHPKGVTVDDRGNNYVVDTDNMAIRKISDTGITTIAGGKKSRGGGHVDGPSEDAKFSNDFDVVYIGSSCSILVIHRGNQAIREIQPHFDDCAYQYGSGFPLGITVLVAVGFFGYMLALLQHRVGIILSSQNDESLLKPGSQSPYQKQLKSSVRPSLIPTECEEEKQGESFFGSLGRLIAQTGASALEILRRLIPWIQRKNWSHHSQPQEWYHQQQKFSNTWPVQDSYVIPDKEEPPSIETRTPLEGKPLHSCLRILQRCSSSGKAMLSTVEGRSAFQRVQKWTRKVNLFKNDFFFHSCKFQPTLEFGCCVSPWESSLL